MGPCPAADQSQVLVLGNLILLIFKTRLDILANVVQKQQLQHNTGPCIPRQVTIKYLEQLWLVTWSDNFKYQCCLKYNSNSLKWNYCELILNNRSYHKIFEIYNGDDLVFNWPIQHTRMMRWHAQFNSNFYYLNSNRDNCCRHSKHCVQWPICSQWSPINKLSAFSTLTLPCLDNTLPT